MVHSGSRHIGNEVAKYYQDEGRKAFWGGARHQVDAAVAELKAQGRFQEIQPTINRLRKEHEISLPKDLAYVEAVSGCYPAAFSLVGGFPKAPGSEQGSYLRIFANAFYLEGTTLLVGIGKFRK